LTIIAMGRGTSCPAPFPTSGALAGDYTVAGYVSIHVTGATGAPNKSITATMDCTRTTSSPAGGAFFGYRSTNVYLAQ
jgi:hypothetical protein